jgi:hypothetical protein
MQDEPRPLNERDDEPIPRELDCVVEDLRAVYLVAPAPAVADAHLAAMADAFGTSELVDARVLPIRIPRRRLVVAAAAFSAVLGTAGLAAAGGLPAPVQNRIAAFVAPIGIAIPRNDVEPAIRAPSSPAHPGTSNGRHSTGTANKPGDPRSPGSASDPGSTYPGSLGNAPDDGTDPNQPNNTPRPGGTIPGEQPSDPPGTVPQTVDPDPTTPGTLKPDPPPSGTTVPESPDGERLATSPAAFDGTHQAARIGSGPDDREDSPPLHPLAAVSLGVGSLVLVRERSGAGVRRSRPVARRLRSLLHLPSGPRGDDAPSTSHSSADRTFRGEV